MGNTFFEHYHETILDAISEGVFTVDSHWRVKSFNRAAEKITGISREDAIGLPCRQVFQADICERDCVLKRTMIAGKPIVNAIAYVLNQAGKRVPIRISTAVLKNNNGRVVGGVEIFQDMSQIEQHRKALAKHYTFEDIIGKSPAMLDLFRVLPQIAKSDSTVLIEGASGTGKELFAHAVHSLSFRKNMPFIAVNCAALPDTLLESELFGYKAGAFTGARKNKPGWFSRADGGTIFLDEIGDISPAMQVRLLRVLQEQQFEPLGAVKPVKVDVRVVVATNRDLTAMVGERTFREDLYYRIRVIRLRLPDLNDRREDIPLLVDHLVDKFKRRMGKDIIGVSRQVMPILLEHNYQGNVRELENIIEHAFVLCQGSIIEPGHLPLSLLSDPMGDFLNIQEPANFKKMEILMISESLRRHHGNRKQVAKELGIHTSTLYRKIKMLGIKTPRKDGRSQHWTNGNSP